MTRIRAAGLAFAVDGPVPLRHQWFMLPIRDHNPSGRTPYVTYLLMAANILIFLAYWGIEPDYRAINAVFDAYAMTPVKLTAGVGYETLITSQFLHGGWLHLAGNMLFLWIFGDNIEDELGHIGFLVFYLLAGVAAALAQYAFEPLSPVPMVGASGAIAGVMGAYLLMFPRARVDIFIFFIIFFRIFPIPAWIMLMLWFGMQFFGGLATISDEGGVAYWAHAGGFVAGLLMIVPLWLRRGGPGFWRRTDGHPPHPEATYSASSIPKIRRNR